MREYDIHTKLELEMSSFQYCKGERLYEASLKYIIYHAGIVDSCEQFLLNIVIEIWWLCEIKCVPRSNILNFFYSKDLQFFMTIFCWPFPDVSRS